MTLPLTPAMLEGAYEFLRTTPPFSRWKLPHADNVEFHVIRKNTMHGYYDEGDTSEDRIAISEWTVGHTVSLMETMAHEMVHLRQDRLGYTGNLHKGRNGPVFRRLARQVCKFHGFDHRRF